MTVTLGSKEVLQSLDMPANLIPLKNDLTLGIDCISKFDPIRVVSPLPEEVSHPRAEDMSQHPSKVLLFEVLFVGTDSELQEGFAKSLLEDSCQKLERGLDSMLSAFSVSFFERLGEVKQLRETISELQALQASREFNSLGA